MLVLVMSLSGSIVFLIILACICFNKNLISCQWIYSILKIDLIFFCIPLPALSNELNYMMVQVFGLPSKSSHSIYKINNIIQIDITGMISFDWKVYIFIIWIVWFVGMIIAYKKHSVWYTEVKEKINDKNTVDFDNYMEVFEQLKKELGMKQKVKLIWSDNTMSTCTFGVISKYIILNNNHVTEENIYLILKHELIHIKRVDILFKYIAIFALLINWFNPLVYLYIYMLSVYCELSCDSILIQNLNKWEKKKYGELIITMALEKTDNKQHYQAFLSNGKRNVKRRLKNLFKLEKPKKLVRFCSFIMGCAIVFFGSLPVYAYEEPIIVAWQTEKQFLESEIHEVGEVEREFINDKHMEYSDNGASILREFIDNNGIVYKLEKLNVAGNNEKLLCSHIYVSGIYKIHEKFSDNSCKTDYYNADMCKKCNEIVVKSYSHTETSTRCTH